MIQNTENHDPLARIPLLMGGMGAAIEAQEAQGQRQLVASSQLPAKNNGREDIMAFYQYCGIEVIGQTNGDKLFLNVKLPAGWKIEPTDHSMWSNLKDSSGATRATIFYKAAFYDRDAFINMEPRYKIGSEFEGGEYTPDCARKYIVRDGKTNSVLFEADFAKGYDNDNHERQKCKTWLNHHYPDHGNATAYWND